MPSPLDSLGTKNPQELLEMGLDLYGLGRFEDAILCWEQVLSIDANNAQALDYLKTAGMDSPSQRTPVQRPPTKGQVVSFRTADHQVQERKKIEALPATAAATKEQEPAKSYEDLYRMAMQAYVRRDLVQAKHIFQKCLEIRPMDRRVMHNLERLKRTTP